MAPRLDRAHPGLRISPEWLSGVLGSSFPGVDVAQVSILNRTSGTNSNARLAVDYRNASGAPAAFFVKLPSDGPTQRELVKKSGMTAREVGFYRDVAPDALLRFPRAYHVDFDPESGDFVLLLEDCEASGGQFLAPHSVISFETARGAVEDLAAFHLRHLGDQELRRRTAWVGPQIRLREYGAGMLSMALEHCRSGMTDDFARLARFYVDHHDAVHDVWEQGAWSIIHGDCHWGNLFLDGDRIGFFDWGCMAFMPGMRDVGYFLCMGLRVEDRRAYERDLIRVYLERVEAGGGPAMSMAEAWSLYRLHAAYTVPASAPATIYDLLKGKVEFDPHVVAEFLRRSSAAISDLDAFDALSERVRGG